MPSSRQKSSEGRFREPNGRESVHSAGFNQEAAPHERPLSGSFWDSKALNHNRPLGARSGRIEIAPFARAANRSPYRTGGPRRSAAKKAAIRGDRSIFVRRVTAMRTLLPFNLRNVMAAKRTFADRCYR